MLSPPLRNGHKTRASVGGAKLFMNSIIFAAIKARGGRITSSACKQQQSLGVNY